MFDMWVPLITFFLQPKCCTGRHDISCWIPVQSLLSEIFQKSCKMYQKGQCGRTVFYTRHFVFVVTCRALSFRDTLFTIISSSLQNSVGVKHLFDNFCCRVQIRFVCVCVCVFTPLSVLTIFICSKCVLTCTCYSAKRLFCFYTSGGCFHMNKLLLPHQILRLTK